MMKNVDLEYIGKIIDNMLDLPIYMYDDTLLKYYNFAATKFSDPFKIFKNEILNINDNISIFIAPNNNIYGIIKAGSARVFLGPILDTKNENNKQKFAQMLLLINYILNNQKLEIKDIFIYNYNKNFKKINFNFFKNNNYNLNKTKLFQDVLNYIKNHLYEPIKTQDIANSLYISRSHLSRKFKAESGIVLNDFILLEKIKEAKNLIANAKNPLSVTAIRLGFSSQSHFTRVFKKYTGVTPGEFKETIG